MPPYGQGSPSPHKMQRVFVATEQQPTDQFLPAEAKSATGDLPVGVREFTRGQESLRFVRVGLNDRHLTRYQCLGGILPQNTNRFVRLHATTKKAHPDGGTMIVVRDTSILTPAEATSFVQRYCSFANFINIMSSLGFYAETQFSMQLLSALAMQICRDANAIRGIFAAAKFKWVMFIEASVYDILVRFHLCDANGSILPDEFMADHRGHDFYPGLNAPDLYIEEAVEDGPRQHGAEIRTQSGIDSAVCISLPDLHWIGVGGPPAPPHPAFEAAVEGALAIANAALAAAEVAPQPMLP